MALGLPRRNKLLRRKSPQVETEQEPGGQLAPPSGTGRLWSGRVQTKEQGSGPLCVREVVCRPPSCSPTAVGGGTASVPGSGGERRRLLRLQQALLTQDTPLGPEGNPRSGAQSVVSSAFNSATIPLAQRSPVESITPAVALDRVSQVESDDPTPAPVVLKALQKAGMFRVASKCFRRVPTPAVPTSAKVDSEPETESEEQAARAGSEEQAASAALAGKPRAAAGNVHIRAAMRRRPACAKPKNKARSKAKARAKSVIKSRGARSLATEVEPVQPSPAPTSDVDQPAAVAPGSDTVTESSGAPAAVEVISISSSAPGEGVAQSPCGHECGTSPLVSGSPGADAPDPVAGEELEITEDHLAGERNQSVEHAPSAGLALSCHAGSGPIDIWTQDSSQDHGGVVAVDSGVRQSQRQSPAHQDEPRAADAQCSSNDGGGSPGIQALTDAAQHQADNPAGQGAGLPDTVDECEDHEPAVRRRPSLLSRLVQRPDRSVSAAHVAMPRADQQQPRSRHVQRVDVVSNVESALCIPTARGAARIAAAERVSLDPVKRADHCSDPQLDSPEPRQAPSKRLKKDARADFVFQWINEAAADFDDRCRVTKLAARMGSRIVSGEDLHPDTTHVVAVVLHRSSKYLYAAAKGIPFVTPSFLQAIAEDPASCQQVESHCVTCWGTLPILGATPKHRIQRPFDGVEVAYLQLPNIPDLPAFATIADLVQLGGGTISRRPSHRATVVVSQEVSRLPAKRRSALPNGAMYVCYLLDVLVLGTAVPHPSCYLARNGKTHVAVTR